MGSIPIVPYQFDLLGNTMKHLYFLVLLNHKETSAGSGPLLLEPLGILTGYMCRRHPHLICTLIVSDTA